MSPLALVLIVLLVLIFYCSAHNGSPLA